MKVPGTRAEPEPTGTDLHRDINGYKGLCWTEARRPDARIRQQFSDC